MFGIFMFTGEQFSSELRCGSRKMGKLATEGGRAAAKKELGVGRKQQLQSGHVFAFNKVLSVMFLR